MHRPTDSRRPTETAAGAGTHISWPRRLFNHWVSHSALSLHLTLGGLSLACFAVGTLLSENMTGSPLPGRLRLLGFAGLFGVLLLMLLHQNLHGADHFLSHFRYISNLPDAQLRQVSLFCMLLFLAVSALLMAGCAWGITSLWAALMAWLSGLSRPSSQEPGSLILPDTDQSSPDLAALAEQIRPAPSWLPLAETLMGLAAVLVVAALLLLLLYSLARRLYTFLSRSRTWDDDEKIFIRPVPPYTAVSPEKKRSLRTPFSWLQGPRSPREAIRRHYQRAIRAGLQSQKQDAPPWAAPAELEQAAGCEAPDLHQIYEKARYGASECTKEDADAAKNAAKKLSSAKQPLAEQPQVSRK